MRMQQDNRRSLWDLTRAAGDDHERFIADTTLRMPLATLAQNANPAGLAAELRRQSVLVSSHEQMTAALALLALDGVARRIVLCPPDLKPTHLPFVLATAEVDAILSDHAPDDDADIPAAVRGVTCRPEDLCPVPPDEPRVMTEWILFTSGTTGTPKMVVHTLDTLSGPVERIRALGAGAIWSTYYDIRRYGGLQILLRALLGGGSIVLSSPHESPAEYLARVAANRVTHITGTPSHWRRALMSPVARDISPRYARMSGEVADQAIIDKLRTFYPNATVAHAFASTEAGLAFDVDDGQAGFPAHLVSENGPVAAIRIQDGSMRIRSNRTALRYLGDNMPDLMDADGFVDTSDMIEQRGDRCFFAGRREGIINVGGLKVHPEEVEAIINQHPDVQMSLVKGRANPITGAIVIAEVVRKPATAQPSTDDRDEFKPDEFKPEEFKPEEFKKEILALCRAALPAYKIPASIRVVAALDVGVSGKMARVRA
jgi:acyl-coenzyme A synthetase/AMP-(fatty) acid ligase